MMTARAVATLLLSALSPAAHAACLEGDAVLAHQRALATLRASVEVACPCNAPGQRRRAYLRCVRPVLHQAVDSGALPAACQKTGTRMVRQSTCGTSKRACGEVVESLGPTCRIAPETRCADRRRRDATACAAEPFCSDVVDWTAGTCLDPRDPGPFVAGVRVITFVKKSAVEPTEDRPLETVIWYPATAGGRYTSAYQAFLDAPPAAAGAPFPLVMFSHGSCGYAYQSTFLLPRLASRGFIVASPPHPGNTVFEFPSCGTAAAQVRSFTERPADIAFVLDRMLAASADPASPFAGAVDATRLGMMGHSFGGLTTYQVVTSDPRYKVAVPLAPAVFGMPTVAIPSMTVLGSIDSAVSNPTARAAYERAVSPKYLIEVEHAGHYAFSDGCFPSADCNPPVTLTQPEAHALVLRWVIPFLEVELAGDRHFAPLLAPPTAPGTLYQAVP